MNIFKLPTLVATAIVTTLLCSQPRLLAQGFGKDTLEETPAPVDLGTGKFAAFPFHVSVTARGGYDDNVNLSEFDKQGSPFASIQLGLTYNFGSPRTVLSLSAGGGFTFYTNNIDNGNSDGFDANGYIAFNISHKASTRLTLSASTYLTYQSQPDFQTFNFGGGNFNSQSQDYFFTVDKFTGLYAWTPRFSTATSFTFGYTDYIDDISSSFEDRFEYTFGNEFRFLCWPTTTLVLDYRYGIVDYVQNDLRNSNSNYFLAGFDHNFSPRFNMSLRAGVEIRDFTGNIPNQGDETSPYAEATVNYAVAQNTRVSWTARYALAQPNVQTVLTTTTFRTGLSVKHNFTSRISGGLEFAYEHDDNQGNVLTPSFNEDSYYIVLSGQYAINRNWALNLGYDYTQLSSPSDQVNEYSRNRVYGGATFTF